VLFCDFNEIALLILKNNYMESFHRIIRRDVKIYSSRKLLIKVDLSWPLRRAKVFRCDVFFYLEDHLLGFGGYYTMCSFML
jgi:hypothetical protein